MINHQEVSPVLKSIEENLRKISDNEVEDEKIKALCVDGFDKLSSIIKKSKNTDKQLDKILKLMYEFTEGSDDKLYDLLDKLKSYIEAEN